MSEGDYDHGEGEVEDMLATARFVQGHYPGLPILLAGFSFGAYVQTRVCRELPCRRLVLVGPAVNMFEFGDVPGGTSIIHGEKDELVPLAAVEAWANQHHSKLTVINGADHFFHRKLAQLKQAVMESCQS